MPHDTLNVIDDTNEARRNHGRIPDTGDNYVLEGCTLDYDASEGALSVHGGAITVTHGGQVWIVDVAPRLEGDAIDVPDNSQLEVYYSIGENEVRVQSGAPTAPYLQLGSVDTAAGTTDDSVNRRRDDAVGAFQAEDTRSVEGLVRRPRFATRDELTFPGEYVHHFEDLSSYTGDTGDISANTEDFVSGTQSIEFTTAPGGISAIDRDLPSVQDWTGYAPVFHVSFDGEPDWTSSQIRLYAASGSLSDHRVWSFQGSNQFQPAGWEQVSPTWGEDAGSYDPTSVDRYRLRVDNGGSSEMTVRLDGLRRVEHDDTANIVLIWDDGDEDVLDALQYQQQYGFPLVVAAAPELVGTSGHLSVDQLKEVQAQGGQIVLHDTTNPLWTDYTREEFRDRLRELQDWAIENGLGEQTARYAVPPGNRINGDVMDVAEEHLLGMTGSIISVETLAARGQDPLAMQRTYGDSLAEAIGSTPSTSDGYIDVAIQRGAHLAVTMHSWSSGNTMPQADYETMIDYIAGAHADASHSQTDVNVSTLTETLSTRIGRRVTP